jgi:hypothetical protein
VNPLVRVLLWPLLLATTTFTVAAACDGVVAVIVVLFATVTLVPATPPNVTVAPDRKPVPVIFTDVPPLVVPELGEILFTANALWPRNAAICITQGADARREAVAP